MARERVNLEIPLKFTEWQKVECAAVRLFLSKTVLAKTVNHFNKNMSSNMLFQMLNYLNKYLNTILVSLHTRLEFNSTCLPNMLKLPSPFSFARLNVYFVFPHNMLFKVSQAYQIWFLFNRDLVGVFLFYFVLSLQLVAQNMPLLRDMQRYARLPTSSGYPLPLLLEKRN